MKRTKPPYGTKPRRPTLPAKVSQPGARSSKIRRMADGAGFGWDDDTKFKTVAQEQRENMMRATAPRAAGNLAEFGSGGFSDSTPAAEGFHTGQGSAPGSVGPVITDHTAPGRTYTEAGYSPIGVQSMKGSPLGTLGGITSSGTPLFKAVERPRYADGKSAASVKDGMHMWGMVEGPGGPREDKVGPAKLPGSGEQALLSDGEAVLPADVVQSMNRDFFQNDPDGVEKYSLVNHKNPANKADFKERVQDVGGPMALRDFAGSYADSKKARKCSGGKAVLRLQDGQKQDGQKQDDLPDLIGKPGDAQQALRNRGEQLDAQLAAQDTVAAGGNGETTAATKPMTQVVADAAPAVVDLSAAKGLTAADNAAKVAEANAAAARDQERYAREQAAYETAVAAQAAKAKAAKAKAAEESKLGILGFKDGSPLRKCAGGKPVKKYASGAAFPGVDILNRASAAASNVRNAVASAPAALKANPVRTGLGATAGIAGAYEGFNTPTSQYYERFGLNPSTEGLSLGKDLAVRGAGVASDVVNKALLGLPEQFGAFADKNYDRAPVTKAPVPAAQPAPRATQGTGGAGGTGVITETAPGSNRFEGTGTPDAETPVDRLMRERLQKAIWDNTARRAGWNPLRFAANEKIIADAQAAFSDKNVARVQQNSELLKMLREQQRYGYEQNIKNQAGLPKALESVAGEDKKRLARGLRVHPQVSAYTAGMSPEEAAVFTDTAGRALGGAYGDGDYTQMGLEDTMALENALAADPNAREAGIFKALRLGGLKGLRDYAATIGDGKLVVNPKTGSLYRTQTDADRYLMNQLLERRKQVLPQQ